MRSLSARASSAARRTYDGPKPDDAPYWHEMYHRLRQGFKEGWKRGYAAAKRDLKR